MDWHTLYYGHVSPQEVAQAVKDPEWQAFRQDLKGTSLENKYIMLQKYQSVVRMKLKYDYSGGRITGLEYLKELRLLNVRITNYVTALSRGGLLKPEDYR